MENTSTFAYKAGVKEKVKEIESRLGISGIDHESAPTNNNARKKVSRSVSEDPSPTVSTRPDPVNRRISTSILPSLPSVVSKSRPIEPNPSIHRNDRVRSISPSKSIVPPQQTLAPVAERSEPKLKQTIQSLQRSASHDHCSKETKSVELKRTISHKTTTMEDGNGDADEASTKQPHPIPKPAPRRMMLRQSLQNVAEIETEMDFTSTSTNPGIASGSSTRRSSEDDGIADIDMALESDPYDDSGIPIPKVKDNAFLQQDKTMKQNEIEQSLYLRRRASMIPQSTHQKSDEKPKPFRTRTDSTNSAENFVIQQFSADMDLSRRDSQIEIQLDVLQSIGSPQINSLLRSPVVVRSKTISNSSASILVLGLPQSGKSATIDSLVQHQVAQQGNALNPELVEYTAKIKILDSANLFNLKIIETPGYSNDQTLASDASLMSTLISYLEDKNGLHGRTPTIVLVVFRFDDQRLWNPEDEHPDVVNFLKLIHNFQQHLNNNVHANFVFVLTHYLSGNCSEQEMKRPQGKIVELTNLIQKYTSLPLPIMVVCAENQSQPTDAKTSNEKQKAPKENPIAGTRTLPNGETYLYNLIEKIKILLTKKGRDSLGETVLRTAFGIEYPYSIKECQVTQRIPLISPSHPSAQQMQKTILHAYMDIERTEIFTLLEIGWENIEPKIREKFPDSLYTVQQIFQTKKVRKFEDIPEDPVKVLNLVRQMPSNLAVKDMLLETLQLKVPACYPALYVGQGFDLSKDTTTNVSPFQLANGFKTSPVGLIPNEFQCKIRDDREICFKFFYSVEEFVLERLKDLNLRYSISPNSLSALSSSSSTNQQWGYNHIKKMQEPTKSTVATAVIEYRIFQLTLHQQPELTFKPQFWDTVKEIADLDIKDPSSVSAWRDFFSYWGTHIVKSAFGGGSVEITFRGAVLSKIFAAMKKDSMLPSDEYETTKVFQWLTGDGLDFVANGKGITRDFLQGYDVQAHFNGGDIKFQQIDLTQVESKEMVTDIREEWKESLVMNPVMLESNLVLVPMSYYVRPISEGIATKMDVALHYFYSDFMISQGKQSSCTIL